MDTLNLNPAANYYLLIYIIIAIASKISSNQKALNGVQVISYVIFYFLCFSLSYVFPQMFYALYIIIFLQQNKKKNNKFKSNAILGGNTRGRERFSRLLALQFTRERTQRLTPGNNQAARCPSQKKEKQVINTVSHIHNSPGCLTVRTDLRCLRDSHVSGKHLQR